MNGRPFGAWFAPALLGLSLLAAPAGAADWLPPPPPQAEYSAYEVRLGAFAHSIGGYEKGSYDVNAELLLPRLSTDVSAEYSFLVPRPHIGAMINTNNRTSYAYGGFSWTFNLLPKVFLEPFFGGAVHDGKLTTTDPTWNALGCRVLFHHGVSIGYRLTDNWSVMGTFAHISNGTLCSRNVGQNDYGVRLGYTV